MRSRVGSTPALFRHFIVLATISGSLNRCISQPHNRLKTLRFSSWQALLDAAGALQDLRIPPGNRLEPLMGKLAGRHSIRINGQFRIVFVWTSAGPADVEIVDYHP